MNKSTPLAQLPNANQQQNSFVNDQQKQMVTSAQTAIQNIPIPQNTQIPPEIMNDDDATIQEVLNQINSQKGGAMPPPTPHHQMPPPPHPMYDARVMQDPSEFGGYPFSQQIPPMPPMPPHMGFPPIPPMPTHGPNIDVIMSFLGDDLKLAFLVVSVYVFVNFVPIGSVLGKYIAIDRIPYHDVILKALLCAMLVVFAKKMIMQK